MWRKELFTADLFFPEPSSEVAYNQRGLWVLNDDFEGENLVSDTGDFDLHGVKFSYKNNGGWLGNPARFSGKDGSYGEILKSDDVNIAGSFSWIGAIYFTSTQTGPVLEWGASQIWLIRNQFYATIYSVQNSAEQFAFDSALGNGKWAVLAVSYHNDDGIVTMWVDGVKQEFSSTRIQQTGGIRTGDTMRIGGR